MAKLLGCQTPSKSVFLLDDEITTEYEKAVEIYQLSGRKVLFWQTELLKHIMSKNEDGLYTYTKFGYSVPRRNGKSEILGLRELQGLLNGEKILHTAHRTATSHNAWKTLTRMLNDAGYVDKAEIKKDELDKYEADKIYKAHKANGLESVELATGGTIDFRTRTSKGGLGEGFDLLVIDEAQEYQDDQESSLKYTVSSSMNGQTIMCGTPPTAVSSGTVFVKYRERCLEGKVKNGGWAEWSVEKETDPHDTNAWIQCNPSLGYILSERAVEDEIGTDDIDFNIQRFGLWLSYNQKSDISEKLWNSLKCDKKPVLNGKLFIGIKFGKNGKNVALSVACKTTNEKIFVETLFCRPITQGIDWIGQFLKQVKYEECVCDGKAGEQMILDMAKKEKLKKIVFPTVPEVINANAVFEQALYKESICHNGQEMLTQVVTNCKRRTIGSGGGFGYDALLDDSEIAVMDSAIYAHWSCQKIKERRKQKVQY